jgi:hypothetical protein
MFELRESNPETELEVDVELEVERCSNKTRRAKLNG